MKTNISMGNIFSLAIFKRLLPSLAIVGLLWPSFAAAEKLQVVTTTEDLAALAREVGGDLVEVNPIAKGYQDPHFVEAKPSYLLKLKKADLFIQMGLELEAAWAPALLTAARNPKILPGQPGFLEASGGCEVLQKAEGTVDRSLGDVHPFGNPHLWTDPENGRIIARNIAHRLGELSPREAPVFQDRLKDFEGRLDDAQTRWQSWMAPHRGTRVVTYHNSWPNFAKRFGLEVAAQVEPKPGVPPSPQHVRALIRRMRDERIGLLIMETYFDARLPEKIARETGADLLVLPASVGGETEVRDYIGLFERNIKRLTEILDKRGKNR